jgi:hypothetical protein
MPKVELGSMGIFLTILDTELEGHFRMFSKTQHILVWSFTGNRIDEVRTAMKLVTILCSFVVHL